ncbi:hypothetical protein Acr_00g0055910 [Actinidia rufa]|uniref:ATP-dependent DNA helicase n=1 Tax=Actinidia rufa TaxID=165716 RepID=A0A7J0DM15_9ERIC|nr:hypothetical protein Acr_00g0055910 [Actinidia rufa]
MDSRLLVGRGPTSFTIHRELRHRIGALLPQPGHEGIYAQLYIYDPDSALNVRNRRNPHLRRDCCDGQKTVYNLPTSDEIAVILPGDGTKVNGMRDIILHLRGNNELMRISECHPAYLPLHYVLLFPHGELGWEPQLKQRDVLHGQLANECLTQLQFYSYHLFEWSTEYSTILRAGKLFQEFLVDAWATTEQNRLNYNKLNQGRLRAELYKGLTSIGANGLGPDQVGQRIILPSSFVGSPRHMFEIFQDSMAITHRLDLVACVFELKRKYLMKEIEKKKVFSRKVAHVYTIEFQKWGLPHMHALFFLEGANKIQTCAQVDMVVSTEFSSPEDDPILFETVKSVMVHGLCGARNSNAPCLDTNGRCTKRYPRAFAEGTTMDQDGYPIYRRRNNGRVYRVKGQDVDNRDVMPYNAYLLKMFTYHINVEVCAGIRGVKYIHKYIYKGHDRTTMVLRGVDEIQQYIDSRYIRAPEANRRILGHNLHEEFPSVVVRLALHHVVFNEIESMNSIISRAGGKMSTFTRYFACYASNEAARAFTYQEFPQHFVWQKTQQIWTPRQRGYAIGRMYFAAPNSGGGAGTGKTFLWLHTIATKCWSVGHTVVTVASSGIASLLLVGGRTAHSMFCIPMDILENLFCGFGKQSLQAELFKETKLIIWDEVPMQHRYCVKTVDQTLKDICDNINPFGGITVVLGGDFRQVLPVIPKGV